MEKLVDINIKKEILADRIVELSANYMNLMEKKNIKFPDDKENVIVNLTLELKIRFILAGNSKKLKK